jgi:hypothetical protein
MVILKGVKSEIDVKVCADVRGDSGRIIKVPFIATFKKLSVTQSEELLDSAPDEFDDQKDYLRKQNKFQIDAIKANLLGYRDVPTETGEKFEFTPENLDQMLDVPEYKVALWDGLIYAIRGKDAERKN